MTTNKYSEIFNQLQNELISFRQNPAVIAVSKYVGSEEIKTAYDAGFRDFGENRVSDLMEKLRHYVRVAPIFAGTLLEIFNRIKLKIL